MPSLNSFSIHNDIIEINRDIWSKTAMAPYREDYYKELTSVTWTEKKGYLYSSHLGYLHRYIIKKWYGEEILNDMTQSGWVIDHMNNDGFDCRISNLEFLLKRFNTAKGQTLDIDVERLRVHLSLTLCKDFSTGYYQIHLGCNDPINLFISQKKSVPISTISFLFNCDYRAVLLDAENILISFETTQKIDLASIHCIDWRYEKAIELSLNEEEKGNPLISRDDGVFFLPGNGIWIHSLPVINGWVPNINNENIRN